MSNVTCEKDAAAGTLTITAEYTAPADRVWELWADPRLLERWWGPPTHPATVTDHDLSPGGTVRYYMTAPDGQQFHGGWRVLAVDPPRRIELEDYFADADGEPAEDMPTSTTVVSIDEIGSEKTRMTIHSRYPNPAQLAKVLEMGMEEGITAALGQIDALLAEPEA